jgi:DNA topoisomerase I
VDVDHDFAPEYVVSDDRRKQVAEISKAAKSADTVFLATDLDREGEAIAWHVAEAATIPKSKTQRVTFNEITEGAIRDAFANPRVIDTNLVDAQQARRIVDRLVGYTLSPLISRKVRAGLSAGRVQSVAVRLVVEREREIEAFTAQEYWTLEAILSTVDGSRFAAEVVRIDGKPIRIGEGGQPIGDGDTADVHAALLRTLKPEVTKVATRKQSRSPAPPFTTSTLQQEASRKLGFSPKRTMSVAQKLYEGVDTPDGHLGLITYMRTDSTAIAGVAMGEARDVIRDRFGEPYTMPKGRVYKTKSKGAQEAHESIRPTSFRRDPDSLAGSLKPEELRLYRLIWQRALASQMAAKELETTTADLAAGAYELRASATKTLFDGFSAVYTEGRDDGAEDEEERRLPPLAEGDVTTVEDVTPTQHFTEPPPRFTEATLIKALEEHGIGRPSTYAATISTILDRGYVRVEDRRLRPEIVANIVTDLLVEYFATTSTSSSPPGWRRSSTRSPAASATGCRCSRRSTRRSATASPRSARTPAGATSRPRRPTRSARWATRWSSASGGTAGSSPARSTRSTRSRGRCPATRPRPSRARARPARSAGRGRSSARTAGSGPSSAARATPTAPTSRRKARRRPSRSSSRSSAPRTPTARSSPVAPGGPATSSGDAPTTPSATTRRTSSRSGRSTTRTRARGEEGRVRDLPEVRRRRAAARRHGSRRPAARRRAAQPGGARPAGPERWDRTARRRPGWQPWRPRGTRRGYARDATDATDREHSGRVSGAAASHPALARFLRGLAARDASPNTRRSYETAVGAYLDWLQARGVDWRRPSRGDLRAYLAELGSRGARSSTAQRLAGDPLVPPPRRT